MIGRCAALLPLAGCFLIHGNDASCPHDRTIAIATQDDVAAFAGCTHARDVAIRTGASVDLAPLAKLERIDGDLVIGPTVGLEEVGLNGLEHVGGAIRASDNAAMHGLYLPRLIDAGRVVVDGNPGLRTIAMPRIAAIHGPLVVADNPRLELLTASDLVAIDRELVIAGEPKLDNLELAHLAAADGVRLDNDPKLPAALAQKLAALPPLPPKPKRR
ncbi:MAG TPA: hypothetical protein VH143_02790 [Kofleriaceae bacterium]|nr:hypothetical protein [Kofleriaceae bacterium]